MQLYDSTLACSWYVARVYDDAFLPVQQYFATNVIILRSGSFKTGNYVDHPISSDNSLLSQKLLLKSNSIIHCMWPWVLPTHAIWSLSDAIQICKLERAVDGVPSQIPTLKFLTPSTPKSQPCGMTTPIE